MLIGKIYWVQDDFAYEGQYKIKLDSKSQKSSYKDSEHVVTKIDNVVIDEFVIKFTTKPYDIDGEAFSYSINLNSFDKEFIYKGFATSLTDEEEPIEVKCELFENKRAYHLYGTWIEYDMVYTWWAKIDKAKNKHV
jgi:hypothetical protein